MHSYVDIHHFLPKTDYKPLLDLLPQIREAMVDQRVYEKMDKDNILVFENRILECMKVYYRLVGIDDKVIAGEKKPMGILPRYTQSLISYFQELQKQSPPNKEILTLEYSGVDTIKIRYKYTYSVIKKLVKLALRNPKNIDDPLKIFLKGGALHDLIGIQFICSYPYEKEWVARTLYNFFEYDHRTDDHLLYGFYTVEKKSGYRGLHCDHTFFNPRFDANISTKDESLSVDPQTLFKLLEPQDNTMMVLKKLKDYFNIEIQLHTTFESLWSSMEHTNNYNIQAKGRGRNSKITVQWKLLADNMKKLEEQFQQLQIDTQQVRFEVQHHSPYLPVKELLNRLNSDAYTIYDNSVKKIEDLEELLRSHEISRQDYLYQLEKEVKSINTFAFKQENLTIQIIFRMQSAFIYYGLANQRDYFNSVDINKFVQKTLNCYQEISLFLSSYPKIFKGNLLNIVTTIRYLYLGQKYGLGLMNPSIDKFKDKKTPAMSYSQSLSSFKTGISLLAQLSKVDMAYLQEDSATTLKIIHHYDILIREWELFNSPDDSKISAEISKNISIFRKQFITPTLQKQFNSLLQSDKIKNIGFVVNFYTTLVWHGLQRPMDALKEIINYSAYDKIKASDLFYYELASYRFLCLNRCVLVEDCTKVVVNDSNIDPIKTKHFSNYHKKNMIWLLFRIKRHESHYKFQKARLYFEQLTQSKFKMDHFSGGM